MRGEDEDQLYKCYRLCLARVIRKPTDPKRAAAEFPKMKEKPSITVANGTRDASESEWLNIKRQMKMTAASTTERSTASNFATMDPTS
jgi:hypothetical protein